MVYRFLTLAILTFYSPLGNLCTKFAKGFNLHRSVIYRINTATY